MKLLIDATIEELKERIAQLEDKFVDEDGTTYQATAFTPVVTIEVDEWDDNSEQLAFYIHDWPRIQKIVNNAIANVDTKG